MTKLFNFLRIPTILAQDKEFLSSLTPFHLDLIAASLDAPEGIVGLKHLAELGYAEKYLQRGRKLERAEMARLASDVACLHPTMKSIPWFVGAAYSIRYARGMVGSKQLICRIDRPGQHWLLRVYYGSQLVGNLLTREGKSSKADPTYIEVPRKIWETCPHKYKAALVYITYLAHWTNHKWTTVETLGMLCGLSGQYKEQARKLRKGCAGFGLDVKIVYDKLRRVHVVHFENRRQMYAKPGRRPRYAV